VTDAAYSNSIDKIRRIENGRPSQQAVTAQEADRGSQAGGFKACGPDNRLRLRNARSKAGESSDRPEIVSVSGATDIAREKNSPPYASVDAHPLVRTEGRQAAGGRLKKMSSATHSPRMDARAFFMPSNRWRRQAADPHFSLTADAVLN
jgi:hypothetical protein